MRRLLLTAAIVLAAALPAHAALKTGTAAPDFTAPASLAGKQFEFSLAEARKTGPVVVYFYPSAYTGGCNVQARAFAEEADHYKAAGATIVWSKIDATGFTSNAPFCRRL